MNSRPGHLLIIEGARDVVEILRRVRPGLAVTVMVATQRLAKIRFPGECARIVVLSESAPINEWVALAHCVHELAPVQAIGAFGEYDQDKAAAIATALKLSFSPQDVIATVYNKALMRQRLREVGIENIPSAIANSVADVARFGQQNGFPLIVKPINGTGSKAIVKILSENEEAEGFDRAIQAAGTPHRAFVVEPFLHGPEISVEAFSEKGAHRILGITEKESDQNFVEMGHMVRLPTPDDTPVLDYVPRLLDALGITDGPTHTELILTSAGPRMVETHTRAGGDQIPQLFEAITGIDMIELAVRQVLGERVLVELDERLAAAGSAVRFGAIRFLAPPKTGTLVSVENVTEAAGLPAVTGCTLLKKPTDPLIAPARDSYDRLAFSTAVAASSAAALDAAAQALSILKVTVGEECD
jgi:biotin carboxylase